MMRRIVTRLRSLVTRGRMEQDLDRELAFHLDMLTEQNVRAGMSPPAARRSALQHFGAVENVKDAVRDTWLSRTWETLGQDAQYGLRSIRRTPGFALVVIVTMALGIGANTAIFSVVNAVLLRPLPYPGSDKLVVLRQQRPLAGQNDIGFSALEIADYAKQSVALESISEFHSMWFILLGRAEPERVSTGVVSSNYFNTLGVTPMLGRTFAAHDEEPGAPAVLLLSHKYWKSSFGGDPTIIGRVFEMNDRPHEVIGVLPPVPQYPEEVDVYMPTSACPFRSSPRMREARDGRMMSALARVRKDVTLDKARADLNVVAARMQKDHPQFYPASQGWGTTATPLQEEVTQSFETTLLVLLGTAGFVLLIVCASIANLTLARMVRRDREMAVRAALGASRRRLIRQLLTESTLLAVIGGMLGLAFAVWGVGLLTSFAERYTTRAQEISIDRTVLLFTFIVSIATGLIFGSVPALARRLGTTPALREGGRSTQQAHGLRSALIVAQVAVSFMLLIGAGLTVRTLYNLQQVDPGIRTDNVLTMRLDLNFSKYTSPVTRGAFWERLDERLRAIPGVVSVGGAGTFPLNDQGPFSQAIQIEGVQYPADAPRPRANIRIISTGYFETLGQPLLAGRNFRPSDRGQENPVVIVSKTMAQHYWPDADPIGRKISGNGGRTWSTVVGVIADARQQLNQAPGDEVYVPMLQSGQLSSTWLIRTNLDAAAMTRQVREAIYSIDPQQPADRFRTLDAVRESTLESPRLTAILIGLFALLALVITSAGMAGVIAFSVNQRTQEFGLRMALGAQRGRVLGMVLRQGLQLVLIGLAIGLAGSLVLARLMTTLLFGVEPTDAVTFVAVSAVLVAVAALACFVPARRAASVDPMIALRVSVFVLMLGGSVAYAQRPTEDALDGVDTVVLLTQGKEVFGKGEFKSIHGRFTYLFSSAETKAQFDKAPEKYAIQLGGVCARMGRTVSGNPSDYIVHDGKIYIFGSDACHKAFAAAPDAFLPKPTPPMPADADSVRKGHALLDKAAAALGGDVANITTYVETQSIVQKRPTGEVTIVARNLWSFPAAAARSDRRMPMMDGNVMTFGTLMTGDAAWGVGPQGMSPVVAEAVPSVQQDLGRHIVPVLKARKQQGVAVAALGPATVAGTPVERVRVRRGGLDVTLNIDSSNGRVHSTTFIDRGPGGQYGEITVAFSDFRQVDGYLLPFKESVSFNGTPEPSVSRTLESIVINGPIDAALITPPAAVRK